MYSPHVRSQYRLFPGIVKECPIAHGYKADPIFDVSARKRVAVKAKYISQGESKICRSLEDMRKL